MSGKNKPVKYKVIGYRLIADHEAKDYRVTLRLRNIKGSAAVSDPKFKTEYFSNEKNAVTYAVSESKKEQTYDE